MRIHCLKMNKVIFFFVTCVVSFLESKLAHLFYNRVDLISHLAVLILLIFILVIVVFVFYVVFACY